MSCFGQQAVFDPAQTRAMRAAYLLACERLALDPGDLASRKELATAILILTASGGTAAENLAQEAAALFRARRGAEILRPGRERRRLVRFGRRGRAEAVPARTSTPMGAAR